MTIYEAHAVISKDAFLQDPSETIPAQALMILLHTHKIALREPCLVDRPTITGLAAITQRHAAQVVATLWPDASDTRRTHYVYWYWKFNLETPFGIADVISAEWKARVEHLRKKICDHPLVQSIEPED